MANFSYMSQSGQIQYNLVELVVDTEAEVLDLPTNVAPGSSCLILENSKVYMFNNAGFWKELE